LARTCTAKVSRWPWTARRQTNTGSVVWPNGAAVRCAAVAGRHLASAGLGTPELASSARSTCRADGLEGAAADETVVEAELLAIVVG
jgi:hypothetical protein